jgi:hypothetical protein
MPGRTSKHGPSGSSHAREEWDEEAALSYAPAVDEHVGQSQVELVKQRHEQMLLAIDGVLGVGIGRTPIGDEAIILYLRHASVARRVPSRIEGYPVETTVTGEIDAYVGPGGAAPRPAR